MYLVCNDLFLIFLLWLEGEDVQGQDQPLKLINIIFESGLCCWEYYSFLRKNLLQMPQFCEYYQNERVMHFEKLDC